MSGHNENCEFENVVIKKMELCKAFFDGCRSNIC